MGRKKLLSLKALFFEREEEVNKKSLQMLIYLV